MSKARVAIAGYGTIGQRLADGVVRQEDMELVGIVDLAPTLSLRALSEIGMPYDLYIVDPKRKSEFEAANIPVVGSFEDLLQKVDIALDAAPAGIGAKNKELYEQYDVKAIFQAGSSWYRDLHDLPTI